MERADAPGFWQSVTGSQDEGETLEQTAIREVREETGLDATQFGLTPWDIENRYEIYQRWRHRYAPGVTHNTEHVFGLMLPAPLPVMLRAARASALPVAAVGMRRPNAAFRPATRRPSACCPRAYNLLMTRSAAYRQLQHPQGPVAIQPAVDRARTARPPRHPGNRHRVPAGSAGRPRPARQPLSALAEPAAAPNSWRATSTPILPTARTASTTPATTATPSCRATRFCPGKTRTSPLTPTRVAACCIAKSRCPAWPSRCTASTSTSR